MREYFLGINMSGEIHEFFNNNPKIKSKSGTNNKNNTAGNVSDTFNPASIFINPDSKITRNQAGGDYELFMKFDLDGDGVISGKNSNGENELELLNNAYEDALANSKKSGKGAGSNPIVKMYNRVINFFKNDTGKEIYFDGRVITADGKIDGARQSETLGDCWLLSRINAMADTDFGAEAIRTAVGKDGITQNDDGSFTIKIDRIDEVFTFSRDEVQNAIESGKYSQGDLDVLLFEMAFEKHYDEALARQDELDIKKGIATTSSTRINNDGTRQSSIEGGKTGNRYTDSRDFNNRDIISIMTGSTHLYASSHEDKKITLELKSKYPKDIAATFSSIYSIELGDDGKPIISKIDPEDNNGSTSHAYELKRVETDESGQITNVIVVNPWNNEVEIPLTEEEFNKYCTDIDFDTKNENIVKEYTNAKFKYAEDKISKPGVKFATINDELGNITDIKNFSKEIGGLKSIHENYMSIIEEQTSQLHDSWVKEGVDGMNKYVGTIMWDNGEESTNYLNDFMKKSHQERVLLNRTTFYENIGFDNDEIQDLLEHPEKFELYCNIHGYQY